MKPVIASVGALYAKLEREGYRAIHAHSQTHKSDHFFNFCVTAHAMRDFFLESQSLVGSAQANALHDVWNAEPLLVAASEIANLSKHFQLRNRRTKAPKTTRTRRLVRRRGTVADVFVNDAGDIMLLPRPSSEISLTLSDGTRYDLWEFIIDLTEVWRDFLRRRGITARRLPLTALQDAMPSRGA